VECQGLHSTDLNQGYACKECIEAMFNTKKYNREYQHRRYTTDPEFRRKTIEANVKCKRKRLKTDPEFREKVKIWKKRWYDKHGRAWAKARYQELKNDPEFKKKKHKTYVKYYKKLKADPVRYKKHLLKMKEYYKEHS